MRSTRIFAAALLSATVIIGTSAAGASPQPPRDRSACAKVSGFTVSVLQLSRSGTGPSALEAKAGVKNCGPRPARLRTAIVVRSSTTGAIVAVASPVATLAPGASGHGPTLLVFPLDKQATYQVVALALSGDNTVMDVQLLTVAMPSGPRPRPTTGVDPASPIARSMLAAASR